ncbi:hypothetical protein MKX08_004944 [Trichoderma sp. CBMAI-0020]|nr:hypothetical protein MKX08_004944 [Trichoderma sp. CBMAI-0020]
MDKVDSRKRSREREGRWGYGSLHHATHSAHAAHATHGRTSRSLLRGLDDGDLSGTEQRGNAAGVNETSADNLERVKDTGLDHVNVLALGAVETTVEVRAELVGELANDDRALEAGVLNNGAGRAGDGVLDNGDAELLVKVGSLDLVEGLGRGLDQGSTTTREDALLNGSTGGVQSIDESVLLLADLNLGRATDLDDGNTARQLGQTLLELLLLVLRGGGVGNDAADLLASLSNGVLAALTVEEDGVLLGDGDGASRSQHVGGGLLELDVKVVAEDGTVGQDGKIAKDGLAVVTEAGGLDGGDLELATELVQDADSQGLAVNVLGNDDQRTAELGRGLEGGDDVLNSRDLLLREEDQRVLKLDLGGLGIGDEVGGDVTAVESHTLGNLELVLQGLALLDGNDTLLADLLHGVGNQLADVVVAVGTDGGDLGNLLAGGNVAGVLLQKVDDRVNGSLDASAQVHGVAAGGDVLDGLGEDGTSQDGGTGGSVTSSLVGLGSNILDQLGTEVLKLVLESDGPGDSNTVYSKQHVSNKIFDIYSKSSLEILSIPTLGDLGRAEAGLNQDISALGSQSSGNGLGQSVGTGQERGAGLNTKLELLFHLVSTTNTMSNPNCLVLPCGQIELADQGCFQIGTYKHRTQPRRGHEKPMRAAFCLLVSEIGEKEKKNKKTGGITSLNQDEPAFRGTAGWRRRGSGNCR